MSVEELADGVEMARVGGGLDQDMHQHRPDVRELDAGLGPPVLGLRRCLVEAAFGDDLVGPFDG